MLRARNFAEVMDDMSESYPWMFNASIPVPKRKSIVIRLTDQMDRDGEEKVRAFLTTGSGLTVEKYWPEGEVSTSHFLVHLNFRRQRRPERLHNPFIAKPPEGIIRG